MFSRIMGMGALLVWVGTLFVPVVALGQETVADADAEAEAEADAEAETDADADAEAEADSDIEAESEAEAVTVDPVSARFERALALMDAEDFDQAAVEFERIMELSRGQERFGAALFNLARCREQLREYDSAMDAFNRYSELIGPEGEYYQAVLAKVESLNALLGTLVLSVNVQAYSVVIDGRPVENLERIRWPGGNVEIDVSAVGHVPSRTNVRLTSGEEVRVEIELEPIPEEYSGLPVGYFIGATTVGLVATGVAIAFGVAALACKSDAGCAVGENRDVLPLLADGIGIGALVVFAGATVLAFLTDFDGDSAPPVLGARF